MIRKAVLKARAAHGYAWLEEKGPTFNLDVQQLHRMVGLLNAQTSFACPLALADLKGDNFNGVCHRLTVPHRQPGTNIIRTVRDLRQFLIDNGFDLPRGGRWGLLFVYGSDRDWRILTQAWRDIILANEPTDIFTHQDHQELR